MAGNQTDNEKKQQLISSVEELCRTLSIPFWDVLLLGDGSGSGWRQGIGWAVVLLDRASWASKLLWGGVSCGTVNIAELDPYTKAMQWFFSDDGPGNHRLESLRLVGRPLAVHIVTDSQYVATTGNFPGSRRKHREMWATLDAFATRGVSFTFHHWGRDQITLNMLADEVARQSRVQLEGAYNAAIKILSRRYGVPADAQPEDFFFWQTPPLEPAVPTGPAE